MKHATLILAAIAMATATAAAQSGSLYKQAQAQARQVEASDKASVEPAAGQVKVQSLTAPPKNDPRTFSKEQLITIIVAESASHTTDATSSTAREASIDAQVDEFVRFSCSSSGIVRPVAFRSGKPAIKADGTREFDGSGSTGRTDRLTARITGKIIDIKPNGNLVVEASKKIVVDEESYTLTLTGVCRTLDVGPDNTILSTQIAELEVNKKSNGMVKDATKRGLLHRIADALNIF